jgi:hypothetical protein
MPTRAEVLSDETIGREEPLGVPWRFEPLHVPLPLTGWLMRVLCTIIEIAMLS